MNDADRNPKRRTDVVVRSTPNQQAVYDPVTDTLHRLNSTAMAIWQACDGETSLNELVEAVAMLTDTAIEEANGLVSSAIDELTAAGLLE